MVLTEREQRIPEGPPDEFDPSQDLLAWIESNFKLYGNIYRARVLGRDVYVVSAPEYAQHVLRNNWTNYRKGLAIKRIAILLGNGLMVSEGEFWRSQRRMIQPALHRGAVASFYDIMSTTNFRLLRKWERAAQQNEAVNATSDVSLMVLEVTLRALFGADYPTVAQFFNILHDHPARNMDFAQQFANLGPIVAEVIERRRNDRTESMDVLGILMGARDQSGRPMPDEQLINEAKTIIVAGHETTASTLSLIWYLLSQNPEVEGRLSAELENLVEGEFPEIKDLPKFTYTRLVIDEALRLYPPGWLMTRRAKNDDRLGEYFVPAGTEIYLSPYIIQRHPDLWAEPNSFNPERYNFTDVRETRSPALLPFSLGPRNCIGEFFARTEMQVHLMAVASRVRLRYVEENPPEFEAAVNLRSKHDFLMWPEIRAYAKA
jgi:cytochrome P450